MKKQLVLMMLMGMFAVAAVLSCSKDKDGDSNKSKGKTAAVKYCECMKNGGNDTDCEKSAIPSGSVIDRDELEEFWAVQKAGCQ